MKFDRLPIPEGAIQAVKDLIALREKIVDALTSNDRIAIRLIKKIAQVVARLYAKFQDIRADTDIKPPIRSFTYKKHVAAKKAKPVAAEPPAYDGLAPPTTDVPANTLGE